MEFKLMDPFVDRRQKLSIFTQAKLDLSMKLKLFVGSAFGLLIFLGFYGFRIWDSHQRNQFDGPVAGAPRVPLVNDFPELISNLEKKKSLCESRALYARDYFNKREKEQNKTTPIAPKKAFQFKKKPPAVPPAPVDFETPGSVGQRHYDEAKAEIDSCIGYISTAMTRGFNEADSKIIAEKLAVCESKSTEFLEWSDDLGSKERVSPCSIKFPTEVLERWLAGIDTRNKQTVESLVKRLDSCRLKGWTELESR
jgi:hypothetical protein